MKRTIALLLALLLAFVFVGCQQQEPQSATATDESWTKVEQAGELIMGMDDAFPRWATLMSRPANSSALI